MTSFSLSFFFFFSCSTSTISFDSNSTTGVGVGCFFSFPEAGAEAKGVEDLDDGEAELGLEGRGAELDDSRLY